MAQFLSYRLDGRVNAPYSSAVLSFIASEHPLLKLMRRPTHPNRLEYEAIVSVLRDYARKVTVFDYRHSRRKANCDLYFGLGRGIETIASKPKVAIYYATGASAGFQVMAARQEAEFMTAEGLLVERGEFRWPEDDFGPAERQSDWIYLVGNKWTASTFDLCSHKVRLLPGIALSSGMNRSVDACLSADAMRRDLLWIGSKGILHKGLHVAAMVAARLNCQLHLLGIGDASRRYAHGIARAAGAKFVDHGVVQIPSTKWMSIAQQCAIALGCSVSEGMSTSLLTAASVGVVPVAVESCGVDVGIVVRPRKRADWVDDLSSAVDSALCMPREAFEQLRTECVEQVRQRNTPYRFERALRDYARSDFVVAG